MSSGGLLTEAPAGSASRRTVKVAAQLRDHVVDDFDVERGHGSVVDAKVGAEVLDDALDPVHERTEPAMSASAALLFFFFSGGQDQGPWGMSTYSSAIKSWSRAAFSHCSSLASDLHVAITRPSKQTEFGSSCWKALTSAVCGSVGLSLSAQL